MKLTLFCTRIYIQMLTNCSVPRIQRPFVSETFEPNIERSLWVNHCWHIAHFHNRACLCRVDKCRMLLACVWALSGSEYNKQWRHCKTMHSPRLAYLYPQGARIHAITHTHYTLLVMWLDNLCFSSCVNYRKTGWFEAMWIPDEISWRSNLN